MLSKPGLVASLMLFSAFVLPVPASAQKPGGTMHMYLWDNPPSASVHEEATVSTAMPFMALFNNLVLYDQDRKSTRLNSSHLGISYAVFCLKKKTPTHLI